MSEARPDRRPSVLITGAAGGLAWVVGGLLAEKYRLVGVDTRKLPAGREFPGEFHQIGYTQRKMAELFRKERFEALLHLGRIPVTGGASQNRRFQVNVLGTRNLLDLCAKHGVRRAIVCSTYHVYGAHQHNHLHITEEDPLRASQTFPELSDSVELDHAAQTFSLTHPQVSTVVLRPVNIVGSRVRNQVTELLRNEYCPVLLGYDPMMQFIHATDFARAMLLALESEHSGVYNVSGEGVVPYTRAVRIAGARPVPVPHFLAYGALGLLSRFTPALPKHLVDYYRYPTVVSDAAFRKDFGFQPKVTTVDALRSIRRPL